MIMIWNTQYQFFPTLQSPWVGKWLKILEIVLFYKNWQAYSKNYMENQRLLISKTILKIISKNERVTVFYSRLKGQLQLARHHGISINEY